MRKIAGSFAIVIAVFAGSCGSKKSDDAVATPAASSLSASFTANCALGGCHSSGGTVAPTGTAKLLKGTALSEAAYNTKVRSGVSGTAMASFGTSTYSAADLTADYALLIK